MKLVFAFLYVSLNDGPYTLLCYKAAVFYIHICSFLLKCTAEIQNTSACENKRPLYIGILYFRFRFRLRFFHRHQLVILHRATKLYPN